MSAPLLKPQTSAMAAHVEELEEAAAEAARRAAAERTVRALAHDWLSWLEEVWGAKPSTVKDYSFLLREPGEPFKRGSGTSPGRIMNAFGDRPADEVTTAEVSRFLRALDKEGLTPRNVNKHREVLAAIFTYGCRADTFELPRNPVLGTDKRRQAPPAALDYYEVEEVEALARACEAAQHREPREIFDKGELEARRQEDRQDAEAFRLLFYTGLRLGEMLVLRWGDVNLDGRLLAQSRPCHDRSLASSGIDRTLPLDASTGHGGAAAASMNEQPCRRPHVDACLGRRRSRGRASPDDPDPGKALARRHRSA
jgi:hypothetical protein